ncbi:glycosyltransferase family 2 protein [Salinimonas iocasae]|uniref:Glycosyltransferase 2-like prokaryotic type domain-containing protein n=1 Tax=Salinimonas iocasae TaxID=2572577 RepID=A0A5B7YH13_9ALTE|nr:galactosyltransferase-related protein [Salinimonas iocasae]QCZ94828.1 hypothetical protein FBQ74_15735 [Salinimonas iocasae]
MTQSFSVVTIVKGRTRQLRNLIRSLEHSNVLPAEVVVVWMASPCEDSLITSQHFPIHHKFVAHDTLPIPKARNKGFLGAHYDKAVYLDVDCICSADMLEHIVQSVIPGRVVTTQIKYLEVLPEHVDYKTLAKDAIDCPYTPEQPLNQPISFRAFHTTSFALYINDFENVGGFDESYCGFGVGDVDFAARCEAKGMHLFMLPDKILRQFHPRVDPPINHLSDIVNNAEIFKRKWGQYPVKHWLTEFAKEGFIYEEYPTRGLRVRRLPTQDEIHAHMTTRPY